MAVSLSKSQHSLIAGYCLLRQADHPIAPDEVSRRLSMLHSDDSDDALLGAFSSADDVQLINKQEKNLKALKKQCPLLVENQDGVWLLLFQQVDDKALVKSSDQPMPEWVEAQALFAELSGNTFRVVDKQPSKTSFRWNARWFIPHLLRYKGFIGELLLSALCIQLLALCIPLFFQVVMDKVIVNQAYDTLYVICLAMAMVVVTECMLSITRQYLATHTSTRIDARLGALLYKHLLTLPLGYFTSRSVGVTVMRISQLNSIREFMTGAANTLVLDCLFLWVFFAVMLLYSPQLTGVVFATLPLCFLVVWVITPRLQARLMALYQAAAVNSAFLTESVNNIETIKAHAVERQVVQRFEHQTRDTLLANFYVAKLMHAQDFWVQLFQKLALAAVIYLGAKKVIAVELTVGQLIAFNMMAQHAMQPILKLTQVWRDFVQTKVSLMQIGDVLNTLPEPNPNPSEPNPSEPKSVSETVPESDLVASKGLSLGVENLYFRYHANQPHILKGVSLSIASGERVAIIGESGSGKSSLVKLIQKLYVAESGSLSIAEKPLDQWYLPHLRQQVAVVSQETFLFNRTVRENIALLNAKANLDEIIHVATVAGIHDSIMRLEEGYNTLIEEGGRSLSGGQKQRIAIARALLSQPNLLIFDEATSALDEMMQQTLMTSVAALPSKPTQIYIAHRLSSIKTVDKIIVLKAGQVAESGSHTELINAPDSIYRALWESQQSLQEFSSHPTPTGDSEEG
ncbi:MAG: ABC transporter transmembrane domain-containing protein [Cellvibrionales bacterium]|nr:ABC transporter transmembrane domain-containing protein [Cellvibrionales bacterium]